MYHPSCWCTCHTVSIASTADVAAPLHPFASEQVPVNAYLSNIIVFQGWILQRADSIGLYVSICDSALQNLVVLFLLQCSSPSSIRGNLYTYALGSLRCLLLYMRLAVRIADSLVRGVQRGFCLCHRANKIPIMPDSQLRNKFACSERQKHLER